MSKHRRADSDSIWIDDAERRSNLTRSQFLIWTGQQLCPDVPLYNMAFAFELAGEIEFERLRRLFDAEVASNDALRTVFGAEDGAPRQRVVAAGPRTLDHVDLRGEPDPRAAAERWMQERTRRMCDLGECAYDSAVLAVGAGANVWYLNQHHLVTDAWSSGRIHDRILQAYADGTDTLSPQGAFADYAIRERAERETERSAANRAYWRARALHDDEALRFYGAPARPASAANERVPFEPGDRRSAALLAQAKSMGLLSTDLGVFCTFAALLAGWASRVTNDSRITIGVPVHHRSNRVARETPGLFIELLPLIVDVDPRESFDVLLRQIAERSLEMLRHASPGIASPGINRRCDVVLNVLNRPYATIGGPHASTRWIHPGAADADHQLRLQVHDLDATGAFRTFFDFNAATFGDHERTLALAQFERLLDAFVENPGRALGQVDLRSAEERRAQAAFNAGRRPRVAASIVDRFREWAANDPTRVALDEAGRTVGYGELEAASRALAATLVARGVGRGSLVPIVVGRRSELVLGVLATLRAGAAYLPLSPAEPPDRLARILADAADGDFGPGPLLATPAVELPAGVPYQRFDIGFDAPAAPGDRRDAPPSVRRDSGDVAYVIYTSGSTGRPKGVVIEDGALDNYLAWAIAHYTDGPTDCALHTSPAVDLTVTSVFLPLLTGGRVRIYPEDGAGAAVPILDVFRDDAVDLVKLTPAHLALLQELPGRSERIRTLILGGEDLTSATVRGVLDRFSADTRFFNEYGPTEATVGCMTHRFDRQRDRWTSVPIGRPIDGIAIHLLDSRGQPVPAGVVGEICIGGVGLARGYHNLPEITSAAFDAFRDADGGRLYRSGDLGRWAADGRLEFLGRADDQGKVRGVRVEPGEVEGVLERHPAVRSCAVVLRQAAPRETVICCARCGVPSNHPDVQLDGEGVCTLCTAFAASKAEALRYFETKERFAEVAGEMRARRRGEYDCLALFSGGKDSTYMLYQLIEAGLRPLTFTLDNGYISEEAKANIRRAVAHVGVDHVFGETPHMRAIFADSLARYSNVCDGCFKTIYTLSVNLAREKGIGYVVTGLSRGQIFETRLHDLFRGRIFDVPTIERRIGDARKIYHRVDDAVARNLDVGCFADDGVFDEVQFVDFYRYWDVGLDEVYRFLAGRAPWVRPSDTGRSTNCLINDVGIYVHKRERGFHNYALPYSWDVRVGHKTRAEALEELDDAIDVDRVRTILHEVGYTPKADATHRREPRLVAYYVGDDTDAGAFREWLAPRLLPEMIPTDFVRLDDLPLAASGKVDRARLPEPGRRPSTGRHVSPRNELESRLAEIWQEVLRLEQVGVTDDFFELGGHSLPAIQAIARIDDAFGVAIPIAGFFSAPTIEAIAELVERKLLEEIEQMSDDEVEGSLASD